MNKLNHKELARRLVIRGIRGYKQRFIEEEDLLSGEDKRRVLEEIDRIIEQIKEDKFYKRKADFSCFYSNWRFKSSLDDCNEEFEL